MYLSFSLSLCLYLSLSQSLYLSLSLSFFGQVVSSHHSDQKPVNQTILSWIRNVCDQHHSLSDIVAKISEKVVIAVKPLEYQD